jgi:hypothetical protein
VVAGHSFERHAALDAVDRLDVVASRRYICAIALRSTGIAPRSHMTTPNAMALFLVIFPVT